MAFIDFQAVKLLVSMDTVLNWHSVQLKPAGKDVSRGSCPICKSDSQRCFVVTHSKSLWYCFDECKEGGDQIYLYALLNGVSQKEAALAMLARVSQPKKRRR